jgi:MFS family permease
VFLQVVQNLSFSKTGLVLLPYSAILSIFVWLSMWLSERYGTRIFINLGFAIRSIFGGLCLLFDQNTSLKVIVGVQIVGGVGIGLSNLTSLLAVQAAVARRDVAVVLGSRNYAR